MNKLILSTLALASLSTVIPTNAHAGSSETRALVGGLIGGLIIGSAIDRHNDRHVTVSHCPPPPPAYCPPPAPSGYWREVQVRDWVPGRWVCTRDHCGREIRVYQQGYYTYRTDRVWVATSENHHGHPGGESRRYSRR